MKQLLIIFLVLIAGINTSFIDVNKKYWLACATVMVDNNKIVMPRVIQAPDKQKADKIFRAFLSKDEPKGKVLENMYGIYELTEKNILK